MGAVYRGPHRDLKKRVAIKTLHPAVAALPGARARFLREGEAASRIQHPNVVDVTDVRAVSGLSSSGTTAVVGGSPPAGATDWVFTLTGQSWFQSRGQSDCSQVGAAPLSMVRPSSWVGSLPLTCTRPWASSQQTLTPSDFVPSNAVGYFGSGVAISGNTILVLGEPFDGSGQLGHFGYVFTRSGSTWSQQAKLVPSNLASNSSGAFNCTTTLDGNTAVIATSFGAYVFSSDRPRRRPRESQYRAALPPSDLRSL